jgi:RNA polymerase sigma factor (sigma-70 family)
MAANDGLVHAVIRRQWCGSVPYSQLVQAGRVGLWQALVHFDPTRGTAFSTYAWPAITRHIWREVAQAHSPPQQVLTPNPPRPSPELDEIVQRGEVYDCLHALVDGLPPDLQQVVVLYYGFHGDTLFSLRQIGQRLGISHEMVRQRLLMALVHLRHPANSLQLRQLLDRNTLLDYERADELAQRHLRRRGGRYGR